MSAAARTVPGMNETAVVTLFALVLIPLAFLAGAWLLSRSVRRLEGTVSRIEERTFAVADLAKKDAATLGRLEDEQHNVAGQRLTIKDNLADSTSRAAATDGSPGAAADAALRGH